MLKKSFKIGFLFLALICVVNCNSILYGIQQGKGQLNIVWSAKPLDKFLGDKNYPDSLKSKIRLIQEIKKFAFDSLGIYPSKNYTNMFDQKGKPGMYVVTACAPFALETYTWEFPVVGEFSYKGYFKKKKALREARKLKKEGYDTDIGEVNAWSTLGWFKDPIMSSMLKKNEGQLARLLIHELTHGTIFVKNDVQFNENLASFIGDKGAILFLEHKYGKKSKEMASYFGQLSDLKKIRAHMHAGARKLKEFYDKKGILITQLEKRKKINEIIDSMDTLSLSSSARIKSSQSQKDSLNNTFFTDFLIE